LAALREERKSVLDSKKDDSEDSDLDFGDDDDDSDDDYEESTFVSKPWQQKKKQRSTISRLDQMDDDSDASSASERLAAKDDALASQKAAPPAELEDFVKVNIPRRRLARWCNEPFFEQAVLDSFVRLFLGDDENGEKAYRLCQIIEVKKGEKTYNFPTLNRREKPVRSCWHADIFSCG
jgi:RNA polymerase-associated protein RTF1